MRQGLLIPGVAAAQVDCDAFRKAVDRTSRLVAMESAEPDSSAKGPHTRLEDQIAEFYKPGVTIGAAGYLMIAAQSLIDASNSENGAARAQLRELKIANHLRLIEINLNLMAQNKCSMPKEPLILDLAPALHESTSKGKPQG